MHIDVDHHFPAGGDPSLRSLITQLGEMIMASKEETLAAVEQVRAEAKAAEERVDLAENVRSDIADDFAPEAPPAA